jgi:nucleotide-binding universal stress UspA family protein
VCPDRVVVGDYHRQALTLVRRRLRLVRTVPGLSAFSTAVEGAPAETLVRLGKTSGLLVLGTPRQSPLSRAIVGSVSSAVVARSLSPVVVVCRPPREQIRDGVLLGLSGDPHDEMVLAFGLEYARRNRLRLRAIHCWDPPFGDYGFPPADAVGRRLADVIARWRGEFADVPFDSVMRRGNPVEVLTACSANHRLLVVGRSTRRTRFGAVLGSVSLGVVHHAACPVAVIPPAPPDGACTQPMRSDDVRFARGQGALMTRGGAGTGSDPEGSLP